jgi:hypothetical protein
MRLLVTALTLFALVVPSAAQAKGIDVTRALAQRENLIHGIAGDERLVFVTEPGIGVGTTPRVVALDRFTGREVAALPAPPGGFKLPFTLRVPETGHLVVLDAGGFPPPGVPTVYDYRYRSGRHGFSAELVRSVSFEGLPVAFAEDVEVLPNGEYAVSESVIGALWLIGRDGSVRPGLFPDRPTEPLTQLSGCPFLPIPPTFRIGGLEFEPLGGFAPGVGSLAVRGDELYMSSTCQGGVQKLKIKTLLDTPRSPYERAAEIRTVAKRQYDVESLKGITFNEFDRGDQWIYAGDPFRLQLIRIHSRTGKREVLSKNARLFNFTVATDFLPPVLKGLPNPLVTASDQEYRWPVLNAALDQDEFVPPFIVGEYWRLG